MQKDSSLQSARQRTIFLLDSLGWSHESDRQNTKFYGQSNLFSRSNPMKELNFEQMAAVEGGQCVDMMALSLEDLLDIVEIIDGRISLGGYPPCPLHP